jgi:hypothetical protein
MMGLLLRWIPERGKHLVSTLAAYLNALTGERVHVILSQYAPYKPHLR